MALDMDKIKADLISLAKPELEKRADELRASFLKGVEDFVDTSRIGKLDDLLKKAAGYEIKAITETDHDRAVQYATAAEDVLRQISVILVAEKAVAEKQTAAMIEKAARIAFEGFKSVATGILSVVFKSLLDGLLGSAGGALADAAGGFLGNVVGGNKPA